MFADVRSDVLGKWRSGVRHEQVRERAQVEGSITQRRYGREELKEQPRRRVSD